MNAGTSLYVGPGVRVEGRITQEGKDETIVIAGVFAGDIVTQGRVVLEANGKIEAANELKCFELDAAGVIEGDDVLVEAGIFRLDTTAKVSVGDISLPPGGLEQSRGSVLCAKLRMEAGNAFAADDRLKAPAKAPAKDAVVRASSSASILSSIEVKAPAATSAPSSAVNGPGPSSAPAASQSAAVASLGGTPAFLANAMKAEAASGNVLPMGSSSSASSTSRLESSFDDLDLGSVQSARL